ncbi:hypothetical protein LC040_07715 [Bacillus tianshenii]|nr:hypothetical protein LC040_07715 [Bacillus tianshenii]
MQLQLNQEEKALIKKAIHTAVERASDDEALSYHRLLLRLSETQQPPLEDGFRYDYDDSK